jgi:hypothetical protein
MNFRITGKYNNFKDPAISFPMRAQLAAFLKEDIVEGDGPTERGGERITCTEVITDDRSGCTPTIKQRRTVRRESRGNWKEIKEKKRERRKK